MYSISDLKTGIAIVIDNDPYLVLMSKFSKQGRQGGVASTKIKNLRTGATIQKTFQGNDKLEPADIGYRRVQFLYKDSREFVFMDLGSYDQFRLSDEINEEEEAFLIDGMELDALIYKGKPIAIKMPITIDLKVKSTPPGVKGDTAQGGTKPAIMENGTTIHVPLFVEEGETIRINTERGEYVERV